MADMSRAIRHVLEDQADPGDRSLKTIPTIVLQELTQIVTAFSLDMKEELDRRFHDR